jgi:hypothetical protein
MAILHSAAAMDCVMPIWIVNVMLDGTDLIVPKQSAQMIVTTEASVSMELVIVEKDSQSLTVRNLPAPMIVH